MHAIDWQHTVLSSFRCGLWINTFKWLENDINGESRSVTLSSGDKLELEGKTTAELLPALYQELTTVRPGDFGFELNEPIAIAAADGKIVVIGQAEPGCARDAGRGRGARVR